ncbi:MAG: YajQ family cyclic di-GMP-binding protein [SAR202 cluster bacterium Io17-Chloro-G3]|nr:MAG: YajQ family cyclic di-GMP-binding protein [SAR202 cluster bacterium Io17-Chloro-G3]
MPSFDVVSKTNLNELDNALNGIGREVKQRYDFKGSICSVERSGNNITINADNDMLLRQMHQLLHVYCTRRGVDSKVLDYKPPENANKGTLRQEVLILQGIDDPTARKIIKKVKSSKLKVQIAIQNDELRVTGKKRDDLQQTITAIKDMEFDLPLQFVNFRE